VDVQIRVAVENGNDGRSLAWALDHLGHILQILAEHH